ncbi:hypothetical protein N4R57_19850 [Rhodobacteraceae bacterium D3-12]|nr:hypothetical protein N4R57_19850 [Rhodobacteraceae bacterium D3-12]
MTKINDSVSIPSALLEKGGQGKVLVDGHAINVRVRKGTSNDIAFLFHGAVARDQREIPFFQAFLPDSSSLTQISVFDDSLFHTLSTPIGWYQGHETLPLIELLPKMFAAFSEAFESQNPPIFVGGSSGGYAALFYSNLHKNSTAVVANPQTNLYTYSTKLGTGVEKCLQGCWTETDDVEALASKICLDLAVPYSRPGSNRVIYLQNGADRKHLHTQMGSIMSAVHHRRWPSMTVKVGFWGKLGHSNSIPYSYISKVVDLVSQYPEATSDELLQHSLLGSDIPTVTENSTKKPGKTKDGEVSKNDLINDFLLS